MKAVFLLTMGGPADKTEVRGFLFRLFSDPFILRAPTFIRVPLAAGLALWREKEAAQAYAFLGGGSPIIKNTQAQAQALEKNLGPDYRCFVGALYSKPFIRDVVANIKKCGAKSVTLLPLYPQFSTTTTASALEAAKNEIQKQTKGMIVREIMDFPDEEGFVAATAEQLVAQIEKAKAFGRPRILFSAHGLPEKIVQSGDPYPERCKKTVRAIVARAGCKEGDFLLCYQSRLGPIRWIGPHLWQEIEGAARAKRPIIVVPISFVCEHVETLVELDRACKHLAQTSGAPFWARVACPSCHAGFIEALARKIREINEKT